MSIFSDYKVGALSEVEFHNACVEMNVQDRYEREQEQFFFEPDFDELESLDEEEGTE